MVIDMSAAQVRTVEQVLEGTQELQFRAAEDDEGRDGWIDAVLRRLGSNAQAQAARWFDALEQPQACGRAIGQSADSRSRKRPTAKSMKARVFIGNRPWPG